MKLKQFQEWIQHALFCNKKERLISYENALIPRLKLQLGRFRINPALANTYILKRPAIKMFKTKPTVGPTSLLLYHNKMVLKTRKHYHLDNYVTVITPNSSAFCSSMKHYQYFDTDEGRIFCNVVHPHISSSNKPCYGSFGPNIETTLNNLNINLLSIYLKRWFSSYNGRDSYSKYTCLDQSIIKIDKLTDIVQSRPMHSRTVVIGNEIIITPLIRKSIKTHFNLYSYPDSFYKGIKLLIDHYKWSTEEAVYKLITNLINGVKKYDTASLDYLKNDFPFFHKWFVFDTNKLYHSELLSDSFFKDFKYHPSLTQNQVNLIKTYRDKCLEAKLLVSYNGLGSKLKEYSIEVANHIIANKPFHSQPESIKHYRSLYNKVSKLILSKNILQFKHAITQIERKLNA